MKDTRRDESNSHSSFEAAPGWYVLAASREVSHRPTAHEFAGLPLVSFRSVNGTPSVLLDRCAHRNAPLSLGRVVGSQIQCAYHGWQFGRDGECREVPGLCGEAGHPNRRVPAYACRDSQGWLWFYSVPNVSPESGPYEIPHADQDGYFTVRERIEMPGPLDAVAENALDVPHTAFVHAGLFRKNKDRRPIDVIIRTSRDRVEAEYVGEQRPEGIVGRLLSPAGGEVFHWDRFILPCLAQVEYRLSERAHIVTTAALTPRTPTVTDLFATVAVNVPIPNAVLRTLVKPSAMHIVRQDAVILQRQTEQVQRFGGEAFVSTEIDVLGLRIKKLLRESVAGRLRDSDEERRIKMLV
ncbi:MAG: Rieske 2Fe-2S domain-containing protein [Myxococcota bacterium]